MVTVEFHFDFGSPNAYLGHLVLPEIEKRTGVKFEYKTTTQSIIVGKLSAYARKNKTRRALWEYDNILRSLYLLEYLDSLPLRQHVQRALTRGENYHQLRRAVAYAAATARTRADATSAASASLPTTGGRLTATLAPWRKRSLTWAHYSVAPR